MGTGQSQGRPAGFALDACAALLLDHTLVKPHSAAFMPSTPVHSAPNKWVRRWPRLGLMLLPLWLSSCGSFEPVTAQDLCDEVGYAIAAKTLECSGDADQANRAYEDYRAQSSCPGGNEPVEVGTTSCSEEVLNVSCDTVNVAIDDLGSWVPSSCGALNSGSSQGCARIWRPVIAGASSCPNSDVVQVLQSRYACAANAPPGRYSTCSLSEDCAGRPATYLDNVQYALLTAPQCAGVVEPTDTSACAVVKWTLESAADVRVEAGVVAPADIQTFVDDLESRLVCLPTDTPTAATCGRWLESLSSQGAWEGALIDDLRNTSSYCSEAVSGCSVFQAALSQQIRVCAAFDPAVIDGIAADVASAIPCTTTTSNQDLFSCLGSVGCAPQAGDPQSWIDLLTAQRTNVSACADALGVPGQ